MNLKKILLSIAVVVLSITANTTWAHAESAVEAAVSAFEQNVPYSVESDTIKEGNIMIKWTYRNNFRTNENNLSNPYINITGFELELSEDANFARGKVTSYSINKYIEGEHTYTYKVPISILGKHGKKLYTRVKACGSVKNILGITNEPEDTPYKIGDQVYSNYQNGICWARSQSITNCKRNMERNYFEFIKIDKQNFPGLYKLIKDGYQNCNEDGKKEYYDKNRDGWLDPSEVYEIYTLMNHKYTKSKKDGKYYRSYSWNTYQCKLSNLKGLEYLPWVILLDLRDYTSSKLDMTNYPYINSISMQEFTTKEFKLIAPKARTIHISSETGGSWNKAKLQLIDVSACTSVIELSLSGSYFKYMSAKLPAKGETLRALSLAYSKDKKINLNNYKNLYISHLYASDCTSFNVTKCKQLRYVYFYCVDKLTYVDLSKAKKLVGGDVCYCKRLTPAKIKKIKSAKFTTNKGRWYEATKPYSKLRELISAEMQKY